MTVSSEADVPSVKATYTPTADDLARAFRLHYRAEARRWPTFLAAAISLAILGGLLSAALPD